MRWPSRPPTETSTGCRPLGSAHCTSVGAGRPRALWSPIINPARTDTADLPLDGAPRPGVAGGPHGSPRSGDRRGDRARVCATGSLGRRSSASSAPTSAEGRGRHSRKTPDQLRRVGDGTGLDGDALARASRLVAKIDSAGLAGCDYDLCCRAISARSRSSFARSSGVISAPKSSDSKTGRIVTSTPSSNGARLIHSTASSIDFTCQIQ